jgi:hypothetical protein
LGWDAAAAAQADDTGDRRSDTDSKDDSTQNSHEWG